MTTYSLNTSGNVSIKGFAKGVDIQEYSAKLADIAGLTPSSGDYIKWDGSNFVVDVPAGTVYTADETGLQLVGSEFSIKHSSLVDIMEASPSSGQVLKYNGANWVPSADNNTEYTAGTGLQVVGGEFSISSQPLLDLAAATPSSGQILKFNGSNWIASDDADEDTQYTAGSGLALSGSSFSVDNTVVAVISGSVAQTLTGVKTFSDNIVAQSNLLQQASGHSGYHYSKNFESQSTDATQFTLGSVFLDPDAVVHSDVIVSVCSDNMEQTASFKLTGVAKNDDGTTSSLTLQDEIIYRSDNGIACVFDVDNTTDALRIRCTGLAGVNLRWFAHSKQNSCPKYVA